ncbi:unnamed protein product [Microthlaspi erraticum]|uniref:Retrovirus-related Pol polyprotein from transposon TNT 1-94-like beta-barrel domain-containing protein n=1 Tax=Microthlaspi erraticum TaxID=1685480 RepID=A0A6D2HDC6_9BRAS|nr:unnamed protein product [Microthlaspi erraticum]
MVAEIIQNAVSGDLRYEMFAITEGDFTFDEDMWMIYTTTSNHMTPYVKFFTTLDRTHRAPVVLIDGSTIMAEGRGDVRVVTEDGEMTIKDVLYVPEIDRNVLSAGQMGSLGYSLAIGGGKCSIEDDDGNVFGEAMWEERGFSLRYQVIEGNFTA